MTKEKITDRIQKGEILTIDGATGSNLSARGLPAGYLNEQWIEENPGEIKRLISDFISAGSDIILSCTFCANPIHLEKSPLKGKAEYINRKAVEMAMEAIGQRPVYIAGSLGPIGELMEPFGPLKEADVIRSVREQARYLSEAGVDLFVLETQYSIEEAQASIKGIREISALPLVVSFSYDRGVRTMMGTKVAQMAEAFSTDEVDFLGINCGKSLEDNFKCLEQLRAATEKPIWFKPNAGLPIADSSGATRYSTTPEDDAKWVEAWIQAGASLIGGCCGTTPEHLSAIHQAIVAFTNKQAR